MKTTKILLAMLALGTSSFAQTNAPQAAPAAPAPTASAANPAKLALAREAIAAMQADKMFDGMAAQMKQMATQFSPLPADATPEQRQKAEELQGKILDLAMTEAKVMIGKMDAIYANVYSEAELQAMVSFFKSPEGQSMIAKQPQVAAQIMPLVQEMQQSLMPKMQKLIEETKATKASATPATP